MKKSSFTFIALLMIFMFHSTPWAGAGDQSEGPLKFEATDTLEEIRDKIKNNGYSFTVEHNRVFDMSPEEKEKFFSRHKPLFPRELEARTATGPLAVQRGATLPSSFDWRDYNGHSYIGPIRDQGDCGSCFAFGAAAAAEGTYNWATGNYDENCADFSEAHIAFCLSDYYSTFDGCSGSDYYYDEVKALTEYGVYDEDAFPYKDYPQNQECNIQGNPTYTVFDSWYRIACGDIDAIKTALMTYGVVDAAVLVTSAFEAYSSGIYEDSNTSCDGNPCYFTPTDHIVALVGWDDNGDPENNGYWILRNSWGTDWGENGYMRIKYTSAAVACEGAYLVYEASSSVSKDYAGVFRNRIFFLDSNGNQSSDSGDSSFSFGRATDIPVTGDWDGDGDTDIGVFRNGTFLLDSNGSQSLDSGDNSFPFGRATDTPVTGDWDGDGTTEVGIFFDGTWLLDYNGSQKWDVGDAGFKFGRATDIPVTGDWNGDGTTEVGIFFNGIWLLDYNGSQKWDVGDAGFKFGRATDIPVTGDWDGDGTTEVGIFFNGTWLLDYNGSQTWNVGDTSFSLGTSSDIPVTGAW